MLAIASRIGSTRAERVDVPEPSRPAPRRVLCRTLELGICGTDREILESGQPFVPPDSDLLLLGHECLARIERCGDGVTTLREGDLVVPLVRRPLPAIAPPRLAADRPDLWPFGTYTERGIVEEHGFSQELWEDDPRYLVRVEAESAASAVLAEPVAVAEKAVNEACLVQRGRLQSWGPSAANDAPQTLGERQWPADSPPRVLVTGLGPIAFAALLACRARDWPVTVYGRDTPESPRVAVAREFGADYRSEDEWPDWDDLSAPAIQERGYDLLLECTGSDRAMAKTAPSLRTLGVMAWLGSSRRPQPRELPVAQLMRHAIVRNWLILGSVNAARRDFDDAIQHLKQMPELAQRLITRRVAPADALPHYHRRDTADIKVVVDYR